MTLLKPPPPEHYEAIGRVADAWATLEMEMNMSIWAMMDVEQRVGACVTAQIGSFLPKMKALISLVAFRELDQRFVTELNRLSNRIDGFARQRNRVVHDAWFGDEKNDEIIQFVATAERKLDFGFKPYKTESLIELRKKIHAALADLRKVSDEMLSSKPSFSPKRFSESPGVFRHLLETDSSSEGSALQPLSSPE